MPEPTSEISEELKELITPHLKDHLDPDSWSFIPQMFERVVYTQPENVPMVTLDPIYDYPAMQFSCLTGEFMELTNWDYIVALDEEEETAEREHQELVDTLTAVLQHYHKVDYQVMTDYERVIENRTSLTVDNITLYKYDCPMQTIYLNSQHYPVTYGNQKVDSDYYYYSFNPDDPNDDTNIYDYKVKYEWKRDNVWD